MIFLRFFAFLAGAMILLAPPLMLADVHTRNMSGWAVLRMLVVLAVVAGVFFYIAIVGPRMHRSRRRRTLGGALLVIPLLFGLVTLATRKEPQVLWASGTLMGLAIVLLIGFVFPPFMNGDKRRLRERERVEPTSQPLRGPG